MPTKECPHCGAILSHDEIICSCGFNFPLAGSAGRGAKAARDVAARITGSRKALWAPKGPLGGRSCRRLHTAALGPLPSVALSSAVRRSDYLNESEPAPSRGFEFGNTAKRSSIDMTKARPLPGASSSTVRMGDVICSS